VFFNRGDVTSYREVSHGKSGCVLSGRFLEAIRLCLKNLAKPLIERRLATSVNEPVSWPRRAGAGKARPFFDPHPDMFRPLGKETSRLEFLTNGGAPLTPICGRRSHALPLARAHLHSWGFPEKFRTFAYLECSAEAHEVSCGKLVLICRSSHSTITLAKANGVGTDASNLKETSLICF